MTNKLMLRLAQSTQDDGRACPIHAMHWTARKLLNGTNRIPL